MDLAFEYIVDNGITTGAKYPYRAVDQTCSYAGDGVVTLSSHLDVGKQKMAAMVSALTLGPVSVAIHAGALGF